MKPVNPEECVLCCREIKIYATGLCDHPVCYECSARMRVLCETNECPICRGEIPLVVFTHQPQSFSNTGKKCQQLINKKYQIVFEDEDIKKAFDLLLISQCQICQEIFPTFEKLKEHVRRKHELYYCEICNSSLKIFTFERKCYNRKDLARHKIKGDPDQTSHRGHPLCEYCDVRFVDHDDLFRHLRREHFFCHFCDADGLHQYYQSYDYLRVHFRTDHYLCEEGECVNEKFTAVFRSEIDLKAHKAVQHSKNKSKAEARQARMLDFEFNYVSQQRMTGSSSPRGRRYANQRRNIEEHNANERNQSNAIPEPEPLDTQSTQDFPYLSEGALGVSASIAGKSVESALSMQSLVRNSVHPSYRRNMMSSDDFPALGPSNSTSSDSVVPNQAKRIDFSTTAQLPRKPNSSRFNVTDDSKTDKPAAKSSQQQVTPKWLAKKDCSNFEEAFPKLETKKGRPVSATVGETRAVQSSVSSFHPPTTNNNDNSNQTKAADQFIVIKSKSKKKKPKMPMLQDEEEIEDFVKKPDPVLSVNNFAYLNNIENTEPIKRRPPSRPPRDTWEPDTWETKVSFGKDDFPPLEEVKKPPPPGINVKKARAPPPGFSTNSNVSSNSTSLSLSAIAQIVGNSLKNNLNIQTSQNFYPPSSDFSYLEPPDFQMRNERLLHLINEASKTADKFKEFKSVSRDFRCNAISGREYQKKCLDILGEEDYKDIFPELVALLPDIPKQQELLAVHNEYLNNSYSNSKRKNIRSKSDILSCEVCNQVLVVDDCESHRCLE